MMQSEPAKDAEEVPNSNSTQNPFSEQNTPLSRSVNWTVDRVREFGGNPGPEGSHRLLRAHDNAKESEGTRETEGPK
jgi:hypothetical protein